MNLLKIIINNESNIYLSLFLDSIILFFIQYIVKVIIHKFVKFIKDDRTSYTVFSKIKITVNSLYILSLIYIWGEYVHNILTFISVLSAAFTIAAREIILNFFCGIYIKINKPFKLEDRIEIDNIKGDIISIKLLGFEVLEVSEKEPNGQSTGVLIHFPNSVIFKDSVKNITKGFKYIWNEVEINISLNADLEKNKKIIYNIINNIETVKKIPRKMKNQIKEVSTEYRIYYNNYEPIIYTKIDKDHIVLTLRYLTHPKKARYIDSEFWNHIYEAYKNNEIDLFVQED